MTIETLRAILAQMDQENLYVRSINDPDLKDGAC